MPTKRELEAIRRVLVGAHPSGRPVASGALIVELWAQLGGLDKFALHEVTPTGFKEFHVDVPASQE